MSAHVSYLRICERGSADDLRAMQRDMDELALSPAERDAAATLAAIREAAAFDPRPRRARRLRAWCDGTEVPEL